MADTIKPKSASKIILTKGPRLESTVLSTLKTVSEIVGGTLGPGGHPVLIERREEGLAPWVTKDGVSVARSLGFEDSVQHNILESIRDASVRTASEAGDGTTTATILSESLVRLTTQFCRQNPTTPPIQVIKTIQKLHKDILIPAIERLTLPCDLVSEEGRSRLRSVAKISANGDTELADAVIECFDISGDAGNATIVDQTGPTSIKVQKIDGFPIASGYETSCGPLGPAFINDQAGQRCILDKPAFLLYYGRINDFQILWEIINRLQQASSGGYLNTPNVVLVSTGFSESVLANLASIWNEPSNINVMPLLCPKTAVINSERHFLDDLAAITGATVFDPVTHPLTKAQFEDLGNIVIKEEEVKGQTVTTYDTLGVKFFEMGRYRSNVLGHCDDGILLERVTEVEAALEASESEFDRLHTQERLAKLSGGIAKLTVIGSSSSEIRERKDRADDAICAVRGAIKHGAVIGGGWTLTRLMLELFAANLEGTDLAVLSQILAPSLLGVVDVLYTNAGLVIEEAQNALRESASDGDVSKAVVVDLSSGETLNAQEAGVLDSVPALREALKNSISVASLMGTLGGVVCFGRDHEADLKDTRDAQEFERMCKSTANGGRPVE